MKGLGLSISCTNLFNTHNITMQVCVRVIQKLAEAVELLGMVAKVGTIRFCPNRIVCFLRLCCLGLNKYFLNKYCYHKKNKYVCVKNEN